MPYAYTNIFQVSPCCIIFLFCQLLAGKGVLRCCWERSNGVGKIKTLCD